MVNLEIMLMTRVSDDTVTAIRTKLEEVTSSMYLKPVTQKLRDEITENMREPLASLNPSLKGDVIYDPKKHILQFRVFK